MQITSLTLHNMFSYNGTQTIEFEKVTSIIGTNGFGKTSILNSIKLCLGQQNIDTDSILNNNAEDKKCFVEIDFRDFKCERSWDFQNEESELVTITFPDNHVLESLEADHFIKNKIPEFLVDFLFFDGEVGNNLFLLSATRLKSLFDYIFDLDLLVNTAKDSLQVAKNILEKNSDEESKDLIIQEKKHLELLESISRTKLELEEKNKDLKKQERVLKKKIDQIKKQSKKIETLHLKEEEIQQELDNYTQMAQEVFLFQMPLLFNKRLLEGLEKRKHSPLSMKDENLFSNSFSKFLNEINPSFEEDKAKEIFKDLFLKESSDIELHTTKDEFKNLLIKMRDLQYSLKDLAKEIQQAESSAFEQEMTNSLIEDRDKQKVLILLIANEIKDLEEKIKKEEEEAKEIKKDLTKAFKQNQEKYAFIKGYEDLKKIALVSEKIYLKELEEKLKLFNIRLEANTKNFLKQYEHIEEIFIDEKHKIIIKDGSKYLNTNLLSAGQKQILNFLIVKTILEFKEFASFVMVDTPFGRLSNENKKLLLNECYLQFDNLILLLTDSEFEFVKSQDLKDSRYYIQRDEKGSFIERKND